MNTYFNKTVAEIVNDNFRTSDVFKKYKIDFCCGGHKTLSDVCQTKNISLDAVEAELETVANARNTGLPDTHHWTLSLIVDYIVGNHHEYITRSIPLLLQYTNKVARVHGENHPELKQVQTLFHEAVMELDAHMSKEEHILFPFIKSMEKHFTSRETLQESGFGRIQNPIGMMEHEHDTVGSIFKNIRQLTSDFTPPEDACNTYRVLFSKLEEFETDLHIHIHLENNVLFPRAIKMEQQMLQPNPVL